MEFRKIKKEGTYGVQYKPGSRPTITTYQISPVLAGIKVSRASGVMATPEVKGGPADRAREAAMTAGRRSTGKVSGETAAGSDVL